MGRQLQITQVAEINSSNIKVTFHQLAVTRLINQGILRLGDHKAFFNDREINLQDYILIDQHSITVLSPQAFEFLFSSTNTSSSATQNSEPLKKLQRNNEELKASNARQMATINQLQNLLNDFKIKNDNLRERLRSAREQQEQLAISRQNLKEENLRLQKLVKRLQEERKKQAMVEEKAEKTVDKKPAEKVVAKPKDKKPATKPTAKKAVAKPKVKKSVAKPTVKKAVAKSKVKKPVTKPTAKPKVKKSTAKPTAKKAVAKPKTKKSVKKSANTSYNDIKPATLSVADEKRFKELKAMSADKLAKTLALDTIPVKQRFDNSKDLRILALKAKSQSELARWLHRGSSTIQDWTRATDNEEILKHFKK